MTTQTTASDTWYPQNAINSNDRTSQTDDERIKDITVLPPPEHLIRFFPIRGTAAESLISSTRQSIHNIMAGTEDRLLVVIGPCSIHDPAAALDYAHRLIAQRAKYAGTLEIVMRVYFEKPRTTVGWKGLINDPYLDESYRIDEGLRMARQSLHKNGQVAIVQTNGNADCHVILRGGKAPNYDAASVAAACKDLVAAKLPATLMVDCSHANSSKKHEKQIDVAKDIAAQLSSGSHSVFGVMVESNLEAGAQKFTPGKDSIAGLEYGKSITDACIGWADSVNVLDILSEGVLARRKLTAK